MDVRGLVGGDRELWDELLDRRGELGDAAGAGGLETLGGGGTEGLGRSIERMREGVDVALDSGQEAIILRFVRPVLLVQDGTVTPPADATTFAAGESAVITARLQDAKQHIESALPSVGRVELANHRMSWVGTAWMVAPQVAVTNRHVAEIFAAGAPDAPQLRVADQAGRVVRPSIDWRREHARPHEAVVRVEKVLWIEPDGGPDLALLRVRAADEDGRATPDPIPLLDEEATAAASGAWVVVIGYPQWSPYNDAADQQRIFDGIYGVKRVAPGTVTAVSSDGQLTHDATTLGGCSGSVVLDLASGCAAGLHFGGFEHDRNTAVQAPVIADRLAHHT